jgi:hypothetical protein
VFGQSFLFQRRWQGRTDFLADMFLLLTMNINWCAVRARAPCDRWSRSACLTISVHVHSMQQLRNASELACAETVVIGNTLLNKHMGIILATYMTEYRAVTNTLATIVRKRARKHADSKNARRPQLIVAGVSVAVVFLVAAVGLFVPRWVGSSCRGPLALGLRLTTARPVARAAS